VSPFRRLTVRVLIGYLIVAGAWLLVSHQLLFRLFPGVLHPASLELVEDGLIVLVTAIALAWLLERGARTVEASKQRLAVRDAELQRERARSEAFGGVYHELDSRILRGEPLPETLNLACQRLAEHSGLLMTQIGLRGPDGRLDIRAFAGPGAAFAQGVQVRWDDSPEGQGPTGRAIRTGESALVDVATDPGFAPWREAALEQGFQRGLALPLVAGRETLGALTVFSSTKEQLEGGALELLHRFADRVTLSLLAARHQERIRLQTAALEASASAVLITNQNGVIEWVNPAFTRLTGYSREQALGHTPRLQKSGIHAASFYQTLWSTLLRGDVWHGETHNRRSDGSLYVEEQTITPVRNPEGAIAHFIAVKHDVSERKRQEERIRHLAMHDPLTDLPNRRALERHLARLVAQAGRGRRSAVLYLDVDRFKAVNERLGHLAGDRVLIRLVGLFRATLRPGDMIARLAGDTFAALLEGVDLEEASATAERLRQAVHGSRFRVAGHAFDLGLSLGLAPIDGSHTPEDVLAMAESALDTAKEQGGNRIVTATGRAGRTKRLAVASQWAARIQTALRSDGLVLHFQPVVPLLGKGDASFEALVRLSTGGDGDELALPEAFLPAAERFGLMPEIDTWVLNQVLGLLEREPELRLSINLSGASLGEAQFLELVEARLASARLAPGRLVFEVTETVGVADLAPVQEWAERVREKGCRFALDDFGTGFCSFSYLQTLPVDYVKIDGSFVRNLDTNAADRALVRAMRDVAHALGKQVVAEAVETAAVATVLRELRVEFGQGLHLGAPRATVDQLSAAGVTSPPPPSG